MREANIILYDGTRMKDLIIPYPLFNKRKTPFPLHISLCSTPALGKESNDWLIANNNFNPDIEKALLDVEVYKFVGLAYGATASPSIARVIADYSAWNWIVDELMDNPKYLGNNPTKALEFVNYINQYLTPSLTAVEPKPNMKHGITGESFHKIVSRAKDVGFTDNQSIRFMRAQKEFVDYSYQMIGLRVGCPETLSVKEYTLNRRLTSAVETSFILAEWSVNVFLTNEIHSHEILQQLIVAASDCLCLVNDVHSFPKDFLDGDIHNIIHILWRQEGLRVEKAMKKVTEMALVAANDIDILEKCVIACDEFSDDEKCNIRKYFYSARVFCCGYMEWALGCKRYNVKGCRVMFVNPDTDARDEYDLRPEISKIARKYHVNFN